jgi:acetyl-CoA carboxylase carboxyltransferase component
MAKINLSTSRKDLQELKDRKRFLEDNHRKSSVNKRHAKGKRTARENIEDLCDPNSFQEIGGLIVAAQKGRKSIKELRENTPADGLISGIGTINATIFSEGINCYILSYDYTVLAGTQGAFGHKKTDRLMALAQKAHCPILFFVEGGGGRPGDIDFNLVSTGGLDLPTWHAFARLSGKVPRIAIVGGYCFAGNAAIAGCADVIIATKDSSMGMGGPAMIEGGGLGQYHPKDIGPAKTLAKEGVIDILVENEEEAVAIAKKYLSYFQGELSKWKAPNQEELYNILPEDRRYAYDVNAIINTIADVDSVLELRTQFAKNMVTALIRIEGKPYGVIANSTRFLGGAIDSDAADKASRFLQLCNAFQLPIISLCDTPGFMVGPEHEAKGLIRHSSRLFLSAASLEVPMITVVLRKAYGLGAMAMAGGSFHASFLTLSWQSGEFGAMGLEGAVKLGFKKELDATPNEKERQALYEQLVAQEYQKGKAINAAETLEFDEVIDPVETRKRIATARSCFELNTSKPSSSFIDSW